MIDTDKWREIFSSLGRHKLRTFLTAFSVWWGIFMLVILLGAGKGLENSAEEDFKDDAMSIIRMWPGTTSKEYKGLPAGRRLRFTNDQFKSMSEIEGVQETASRYFLWGQYFIKHKNKSLSFDVQCVNTSYIKFENPELLKGRLLNKMDLTQKRKVCVIGIKVQEGFFTKGENPIGEYLNVKGTDYQIVGVITDTGWEGKKRRIYLPITTTQLVEGTERIHQLTAEMGDVTLAESEVIEDRIRLSLATQMKFDPGDKQAVYLRNQIENYNRFRSTMNMISLFIWFVGIGSIIAGVIGVSNIMLIIVKERTKEIGVRKALGATPSSIVTMIVQEAIFLTSLAGYLGMLCGMGLIIAIQTVMKQNNIEAEFFRNPEVDIKMVLIALGILVVSGGLAGLIPALQAVKINPVVAMKS
ncbi:MAG: ABC transporter permease [Saprospiraceae bacterium]